MTAVGPAVSPSVCTAPNVLYLISCVMRAIKWSVHVSGAILMKWPPIRRRRAPESDSTLSWLAPSSFMALATCQYGASSVSGQQLQYITITASHTVVFD